MAASINDKFTETTNGTRPVPTTLTALKAVSAPSISCAALTGWPTATAVHFIIYTTDTAGRKVAGSQTDWKGIVSGTTITNLSLKAGTDNGYSIGAVVEAAPTAAWADDVTEGITVEHKQTGAHAAITADSLVATGNVQGASVIATGDMQLRSQSLEGIHGNMMFDHVNSGCVLSGDSYGSTRAASMTAGVIYIGGKRIAVSSVSARTYTASKDTYVDVDNTGALTYTEVSNNAASPALAANSIRLGIIVTGASNIANAGSVNQGQEDKILPIASSVAYSVTDSLGNLICPRDPNRKILGYKQLTSNRGSFGTSPALVPELSCPVIVPTGRRVKITTVYPKILPSTAFGEMRASIWEGTVGSGTQLTMAYQQSISSGAVTNAIVVEAIRTPSSSSQTYNAALSNDGNGGSTTNTQNSSTSIASIRVELI